MTAVAKNLLPDSRPRLDDRLNPLLVKEARQSLRSPIFVIQCCLLQGVLVFVTTLDSVRGQREYGVDFFWVALGITVLLLIPIRSGTIIREARQRNLELVGLTRLTSWDIVMGKWLSTVVQSMLVITSVLPYLVLRYFDLGTDLLTELLTLGLTALGSVLASAAFLCNFSMRNWLLRASMFLITLFSMVVITPARAPWTASPTGTLASDLLLIPAGAAVVVIYLLTLAATSLSAEGGRAAIRLRLVFAVIAVTTLGVSASMESEGWTTFVVLISSMVLLMILTEPAPQLFSGYLPFVRWGRLGRLAARFLSPGWPSAVVFSLVVGGVLLPALYLAYISHAALHAVDNGTLAEITFLVMISGLNLALVPLALVRAFSRAREISTGAYAAALGLLAFLGFAGRVMEDFADGAFFGLPWNDGSDFLPIIRHAFAIFPSYTGLSGIRWLMYADDEYASFWLSWTMVSVVVLAVTVLFLWRRARQSAAERRGLFAQAEAWQTAGAAKLWSSLA